MHRIDTHIYKQLLTHEKRRFSELKPYGVESNSFTYRLQRLIREGVVAKAADGQYFLTSAGRLYTDRLNLGKFVPRQFPRPISLLVVRKGDDWLLHTRRIHPLRGWVGLPHANVHSGISLITDAQNRMAKLGIKTKFIYRGGCYLTTYNNGELETYNQINILENVGPLRGELNDSADTDMGKFSWHSKPNFLGEPYLPSLKEINKALNKGKFPFFMELEYELEA